MRETIVARVVSLASVLDQQHKPDADITVAAARATLRPYFPPRKRGGALYYGDHELKLAATPQRDPDTVDMLDAEGRPSREALS